MQDYHYPSLKNSGTINDSSTSVGKMVQVVEATLSSYIQETWQNELRGIKCSRSVRSRHRKKPKLQSILMKIDESQNLTITIVDTAGKSGAEPAFGSSERRELQISSHSGVR